MKLLSILFVVEHLVYFCVRERTQLAVSICAHLLLASLQLNACSIASMQEKKSYIDKTKGNNHRWQG
jgi:hypothetical protein